MLGTLHSHCITCTQLVECNEWLLCRRRVEMNKLLRLSYRNTKALIVSATMELSRDDTKPFSNSTASDIRCVGIHFTRNWYYLFAKWSVFFSLSTFLITCRPSKCIRICFIRIILLTIQLIFFNSKSNQNMHFGDPFDTEIFFSCNSALDLYNVMIRLFILNVMFVIEMEIKWHFSYQIQRKCHFLLRIFKAERFSNRQIDTPIVYIYLARKSSDFMRWVPSIKNISPRTSHSLWNTNYILCFNISFGFLVVIFSFEERHFV